MDDSSFAALTIELLPARHGDSILLTWGSASERHRLLVDGGPAVAYDAVSTRMAEVAAEGSLELLVLTHVDADHIDGALLLANDAGVGLEIGEIWFNGPAQLTDELGPAQGEMLAALVDERGIPHNAFFGGRAVAVPDSGPLPTRTLPGGLTLTVLSPDRGALLRLLEVWTATCVDEGFIFKTKDEALQALRQWQTRGKTDTYLGEPDAPAPDEVAEWAKANIALDSNAPNGSSIVLLAEYGAVSLLLAGDATPTRLRTGLKRLLAERDIDRVELTAFKLPHHGSVRNVTRQILELAPAEYYLFSSDGGGQSRHPNPGAVARCLTYGRPGATLVFNYRSAETLLWDNNELLAGATASFPPDGMAGTKLSIPWIPLVSDPSDHN